jgi:hypothetical protein
MWFEYLFHFGIRTYSPVNQQEYVDAYTAEEVKVAEAAPSVVSQEALLSSRKAPDLSLLARKRITTENERYFFNKLVRALPQYHVFTQVAFSAILKPADGLSKKDHYSIFGVFAQKRADFVVCERESLDIVAVIELDEAEVQEWINHLIEARNQGALPY